MTRDEATTLQAAAATLERLRRETNMAEAARNAELTGPDVEATDGR